MSDFGSDRYPVVVRRFRRAFSEALRAAEPWLAPAPSDAAVREAVRRERRRINAARLRIVLIPLGALHWGIAALFKWGVFEAGLVEASTLFTWQREISTANAIMGTVAWGCAALAWTGEFRAVDGPIGWRRNLTTVVAMLYLTWGAWVSGLDQPVAPGVTAYMLAAGGVALVTRLRPRTSICLYVSSWGVLLAALADSPADHVILISSAVNGTVVTAMAGLLSMLLDRTFERDVIAKHVIAAQQTELLQTNQELTRSLAMLRTTNAELEHEVEVRARTERQLEHLATNDSLTDALNRRRFLELVRQECGRDPARRGPLALAMLDVDRFKGINDRHGHAVGDEVLREVVRCCRAVLRATDLVGRLGGDEFALLVADCPVDEATSLAERVRAAIAVMDLGTREGPLHFTVSIGVTEVVSGAAAVEQALQRADDALYEAKRSGRDRVVTRIVEGAGDETSP